MLKYAPIALILALTGCANLFEPKIPNPYIPAGPSCSDIIVEMDAHKARIEAVGSLGTIRDTGVGIGTVAVVGQLVTGPVGVAVGAVTALAAAVDIDTTNNETRRGLLWHAADRRGCSE